MSVMIPTPSGRQRPTLRLFIGYDSKEPAAYHVCAHSLMTRASCPITITPLVQSHLRAAGLYTRPRTTTESTEFSMTRFLVPYLSGYEGTSVFLDCDMLCRGDVAELWEHVDAQSDRALLCCQHDYDPVAHVKFLGQENHPYVRKNWSSLMVFNNAACRYLTPKRVNQMTGMELHRFQWLHDEELGTLPLEWNWLVGEYAPNPTAKMLHYTLGGPWFPETANVDHADLWVAEREAALGLPVAA